MKMNYKIFLLLMLLVCSKAQAQTVFRGILLSPDMNEKKALEKVFKKQTLVQFNTKGINNFVKQAGSSSRFILHVDNMYDWDIDLKVHDLRSDDCISQRVTDKGVITLPREECNTYAGYLHGKNARDYVRLNISAEKLGGNIIDNGQSFYIEPLKNFVPGASGDKYVIYGSGDGYPVAGRCNQTATIQQKVNEKLASIPPPQNTASAVCQKIEVATESDWEDYNYGVRSSDIAGNLNLVEPLYQNNFGASIIIRYFHEWATSADPYNSTALCTTGDRLTEFTNYWQANFTWVPRDINIMYSGVDFNDGIIGCAIVGNFSSSTGDNCYMVCQWTGYGGIGGFGYTKDEDREVLVAHEMGHCFGANHDVGGCSSNNGPIMCPSINASCTFNCSPYWSAASIITISGGMTSGNGQSRFRNRTFNGGPYSVFSAATFSGNVLYFSSGSLSSVFLPTVFSFVDSAILLAGCSVIPASNASFSFVNGTCNLNDGFAPHTNSQNQSYSSTSENKEVLTGSRIKVYPNPFSSFTNIEIELAKASSVSVSVFDLTGRLVDKPFINKLMSTGKNTLTYTNNKLASNSYLFIIDIDGKRYTEKVIKM